MLVQKREEPLVIHEQELQFHSYVTQSEVSRVFPNQVKLKNPSIVHQVKQIERRFNTAKPAIFVLNVFNQVLYWNDICEELTGIDALHVLGTSNHHLLFNLTSKPHLAEILITNDLQLMRKNYPYSQISSILSGGHQIREWCSGENGGARLLQIHAAPITNEQGKCIGAIEIIVDRTSPGKKRSLTKLKQQKGAWPNSTPDIPFQVITPDGKIKFMNQASEQLFQFTTREALGRSFEQLLASPNEISAFRKSLNGVVSGQQLSEPLELEIQTAEKKRSTVVSILWPAEKNGRCHEIYSLCVDTAPRMRTEEALKFSEFKYRELFENSTDLLAILDLNGNILNINPSFARFLGFEINQLETMNIRELICRQDLALLFQKLKDFIHGKINEPLEYKWIKKNGAQAYVELNFRLLPKDVQQQRTILVIAHDSTRQRNLERDLNESYHQVIDTLVDFIDTKDIYTGKHSQRLVQDCLYLADRADLSQRQRKDLEVAAILHDVGKIKIPKTVLEKFGVLTEEEKKILRTHAEIGAKAVEKIPRFYRISKTIKYHHERFDGTGYPEGLIREQIPVEARILSIVDAFDAMMSDRPYRKSLGIRIAMKELKKGSGTQFDPIIIEEYIEFLKRKYHVDDNGEPDYNEIKN